MVGNVIKGPWGKKGPEVQSESVPDNPLVQFAMKIVARMRDNVDGLDKQISSQNLPVFLATDNDIKAILIAESKQPGSVDKLYLYRCAEEYLQRKKAEFE